MGHILKKNNCSGELANLVYTGKRKDQNDALQTQISTKLPTRSSQASEESQTEDWIPTGHSTLPETVARMCQVRCRHSWLQDRPSTQPQLALPGWCWLTTVGQHRMLEQDVDISYRQQQENLPDILALSKRRENPEVPIQSEVHTVNLIQQQLTLHPDNFQLCLHKSIALVGAITKVCHFTLS